MVVLLRQQRRLRLPQSLFTTVLLVLVLSSLSSTTNAQSSLDAGDSSVLSSAEILTQLYDATSGSNWNDATGWLDFSDTSSSTGDSTGDPLLCTHYGVTCYDETFGDQARRGHIQALDLSDNHLVGTVPAAVFDLPFVESLIFRDNGDLFIPLDSIGNAQYLQNFIISSTHVKDLTGLERATSLQTLHLTSLGIGGPIPAAIFQLTNLRGLFANYNLFTGTLPGSIGSFKYLTELYLYENELTGQIPTEIGLLKNLETLTLSQNAFGGTLPTELNECTSLLELAVQRSPGNTLKGPGISGPLPVLGGLEQIAEIYLDNQNLSGSIPEFFLASAPIHKVITVDLTKNALTGMVPESLVKFERMNLYVADNEINSRTAAFCERIQGWMGGNVGTLDCDAFLCPKGTFAPFGFRTQTQECEPCADAEFYGSSTCASTSTGDVNERAILVSFYNKAGGRYWKQSDNWLNPAESVCDWYGIDCTDGKVSTINLKNNGLTDTPPPELFTLPELRTLDLSSNSINFKFTGIGDAVKLQVLDLTQCDLESLDGVDALQSTSIRKLSVASNALEGAVPAGIFTLTSLEELDISHNRFTGQLSAQIGSLTNLQRLRFFGNSLTGQIPSQIGNLIRLVELMAAENDFSGVLPTNLNSLTSLEVLSLHQSTSTSGIGGPLLSFTDLEQLTSLQLDGNALTGELPQDLLANTLRGNDRIELLLSNNLFTGSVPSKWASRFQQLVVDLSGNRLTGIGDGVCNQGDWMDGAVSRFDCDAILCKKGTYNEFGRQSTVAAECRPCSQANFYGARECGTSSTPESQELDILSDLFDATHGNTWTNSDGWQSQGDYCSWFGVACNSNGKVVKLSLGENGLTGAPPASLFQLSSLRELNLERNEIGFSFEGISQASDLMVLHLSGINLNSVDGIGQAEGLVELHLTDNDLQGSIPDEIFGLTNLRELFLNYNKLEGRISASISNLQNLEELFLFHNRLGGQLPAALGALPNLKSLALSENNFVGSIPQELNDLTSLEVLAIQREGGTDRDTPGNVGVNQGRSDDDGTGLTGPLPAFDKLMNLKQLFLGVNSLSGGIPSNFLDGIVDKSVMIEVDLVSNRLSGPLPASLARFDRLTLYLADNEISGIPDGICRNDDWMDGTVASSGCDAILCSPNSYSEFGREADSSTPCLPCPTDTSAEFFGSFECQSGDADSADDERSILEELYRTTDGDGWRNSDGWMDAEASVCDWHGITCTSDDKKSVQSIHLMQNGLSGNVSRSIYDLPNLEELNFASNDVRVTFTGIASAQNLEYINLDSTGLKSLNGIQQAPNLKLLHVVDNDFGDVFPDVIFSLSTLQVLYLSENSIGSSLPSGIAGLSNLVFFSCSRCGFEGNFPSFLSSLSKLEYLRLDQNAFDGVLPTELQDLVNLKSLDVAKQVSSGGRGGLEGSIPSFANFTQLSELFLNENLFSEALPVDFLATADNSGKLTIDLSSNRITGAIPTGLSRFGELAINLADNLIDTIPPALCALPWNDRLTSTPGCDFILCDIGSFNGLGRMTAELPCLQCTDAADAPTYGSVDCGDAEEREVLETVYRELNGLGWANADGWNSQSHHCTWYGITCYDGGLRDLKIQSIDLSNNNLDGTLPATVWQLDHMSELNLRENSVDVSFEGIGNAQTLQSLLLSQTKVKTLSGIGAANSLVALHMTSNDIDGPLPDELFNLSLLERLYLNFNSFTGTLPTLVGQLTSLRELFLFNNNLNGTLPTEIGRPFRIEVISLGENDFSGEIPRTLSFLPFLEVLSLQNEERERTDEVFGTVANPGFTGDLPQFHRASKLRELYLGSNALAGTIPANFLAGVNDKTVTMRVDLMSNGIYGTIPESLAAFDDLRLFVANNLIHDVPSEICAKGDWMDGLVASGCDAILCPPGMFNSYGRRVVSEPCQTCDHRGAASWYGSTFCGAILPETLTEKEILEEVYAATGGTQWTNRTNWLSDTQSVCTWAGIGCDVNDQGNLVITMIDLSSNNLQGYVPSIVFYLPSLRSLNVDDNAVVLSFRDIEDSASLEELYFASTNVNSLEGIGQATNLRTLKMDDNAFYGRAIPDELFALTNVEVLDISRSGFTGTLSSKVGSLTKLETLRGFDNDLSGELPSEIGTLQLLQVLSLSENNFFGSLPSLDGLSSLTSISLAARTRTTAGLSGPVPAFDGLANLRSIDFGSNSLTGRVPSNLLQSVNSPSLVINVRFDSNILTGSVPSNLASRFTRLNIDLTGNEIDTIPDDFCDLVPQWMDGDVGRYSCRGLLCPAGTFNEFGRQTSEESRCDTCPEPEDVPFLGSTICPSILKEEARQILKLLYQATGGSNWKRSDGWLNDNEDVCDWYGITCRDRKVVESIILGSNNLNGTPPKEIFMIFGLKTLWLYSNPINFKFEGIENAESLESIQLDSTGLSSLAGIGNAPALVDVDVRFNSLSGSLTSEIDRLVDLETFFCGDNDLSGRLPSFATNRKLVTLRVGGNQFSGPLPSFDIHPNMKTVDVSNNRLNGAIPNNFLDAADTTKPIFVDISSNEISGTIPGSLSRFSQVTLYARDNRIEGIDPDICAKESWNGGDVGLFDCDAILCPPGSYSPLGRASNSDSSCLPCKSTVYFGTSQCDNVRGGSSSSAWSSYLLSQYVVGVAALALWFTC